MKKVKLEKMLNEVLDNNLRTQLKNSGSEMTMKGGKSNSVTYSLKRLSDKLSFHGQDYRTMKQKEANPEPKHEDMFYSFAHEEICRVEINDPHDTNESFGVKFYTDISISGNRLGNINIHASFIENIRFNRTNDYGSLRPSVDVWFRFNESNNEWKASVNCSTMNSSDTRDVRKYACALMLANKIVIPKCKQIKDSIFHTSQLELCEEFKHSTLYNGKFPIQ